MGIKIPRVQTDDRLINQIQQNISGAIEPLFNNLIGSFNLTMTGCTTVPIAQATWQRSTTAGQVSVYLPDITGTSNADEAYLDGLPASLWPQTLQACITRIVDNGTTAFGFVTVQVDGRIKLHPTAAGGLFTTSGQKGMSQMCISYIMGI